MSSTAEKAWTVESFLAWERRQDLRHEFDGLRPVAMTGGTFAHDAIQVSLVRALPNRLEGKPCRVVATDYARANAQDAWTARIHAADGVLDMPDIGISLPLAEVCATIDFTALDADDDDI